MIIVLQGFCLVGFALAIFLEKSVHSFPVEINEVDENENEELLDLSYLGNSVFKEPSLETGRILQSWNDTSDLNPEELGEYAEGDIVFPKRSRNGIVASAARWKNGVIPYSIDGRFDSDSLDMIMRAINIYHKYTCISFRKRTATDADWLSIVNGNTGCWSSVGRIGGKQEVNLQSPACTSRVGTPVHELMHAVGFLHEQNRYERDNYVTIAWQNIRKGHETNFDKADDNKFTGYGVDYDFRSVMHYSSTAFSVNGRATIIPKDSTKTEKMGQRQGFSKGDITKINKMYDCPSKTASVIKPSPAASNSKPSGSDGGDQENKENSNPLVDIATGILGLIPHKK